MNEYEKVLDRAKHVHIPEATHDFLVFIGRFQPFHLSHKRVITEALDKSNYVIVLIGSAFSARSHRNPYTWEERKQQIMKSFPIELANRIICRPVEDQLYMTPLWLQNVQTTVEDVVTEFHDFSQDPIISITGCDKDETSFYLKKFPQWALHPVENITNHSSTHIREAVFSSNYEMWMKDAHEYVTPEVKEFLEQFKKTPEYKYLTKEYDAIRKYREGIIRATEVFYEPIMHTVDALVIQSGHILLVKRGAFPGEGLWALPGGYVNPKEEIIAAMLRELREETLISVRDPVLLGSMIGELFTADNVHRDPRGRVISSVGVFHLKDGPLAKIKGSDDAVDGQWFALSQVKREMMFADHFDIYKKLIPRIN